MTWLNAPRREAAEEEEEEDGAGQMNERCGLMRGDEAAGGALASHFDTIRISIVPH